MRDEEVAAAPCARINSPPLFIRCGWNQQVLRAWMEDPGLRWANIDLGKGPEPFLIKERKQEIRRVNTKPAGLPAGCEK